MSTIKSIEDAVAVAARDPVTKSFYRLKQYWKIDNWLGKENRYKINTAKQVKQDAKNRKFYHSELIDYIGASTLGHCFDGWSYLGRAMAAELAGDTASARHLGYYAELRAAMSLLAGEGIGIFSRSHVVVDKDGICFSFGKNKGTHQVVWEALKEWSSSEIGSNRVLDVIRPDGIALAEWIEQFGGSARYVIDNWLAKWGLDLDRLSSDREARNIASYRPTALSGTQPTEIQKTIGAIYKLWMMCGPEGGNGFLLMDRYLLKQVLIHISKPNGDGFNKPIGKQKKKYEKNVDHMLNALAMVPNKQEIKQFLNSKIDEGFSDFLMDASGNAEPEHVDHSKQVLARATLLLRLATGSVADLLQTSGSHFEKELQFWWKEEAVRRRLWSKNMMPETFLDLWDDIEDALGDAEEWLQSSDTEISHWGFWKNREGSGWVLSTVERVFFWGIH